MAVVNAIYLLLLQFDSDRQKNGVSAGMPARRRIPISRLEKFWRL
jgi:hypothetical protein